MNCKLLFFLLLSLPCSGSEPAGRLFHLERSKNRNYVCYDVRQTAGKLDTQSPIDVYWIRVEEGGGKRALSFIQRKMAFGYRVVSRGTNEATVHLTAYDRLPIRICQRAGQWVALATIHGTQLRITKLYVQLRHPNSLHVDYVDIYGETATGEKRKERIYNQSKSPKKQTTPS